MTRFRLSVAPILVLLACALGISASGQDLFEQQDTKSKDAGMTEAKTAVEEKESIF